MDVYETVYDVVLKLEAIDSVVTLLDENLGVAHGDAIRLLNEYRDMLLSLKIK